MPDSHSISTTPSHRGLLQGAVAALATTAATIPALATAEPHPDAELLRLGAEFDRIAAEIDAIENPTWDLFLDDPRYLAAEAQAAPLHEEIRAVETRILDIPARSLAGLAVTARVAAWCNGELRPEREPCPAEKAMVTLARDVLRLAEETQL